MVGALVVLLQAWRQGASPDAALSSVATSSILLAPAGWLIGLAAQTTIDQSVQRRLELELAAVEGPQPDAAPV